MITRLGLQLNEFNWANGTVLDLLSNTAFMEIDDGGLPSEATWSEDNRYYR